MPNRIGRTGEHWVQLLGSGRARLVVNKRLYPKLFDLVGRRVGGGRGDNLTIND
ncbi:MAG: hypothetical protein ABSF08_12755 [Candidatus Cybelea sp.]